ncbi:Outer membrane protein transport protein (OMPP1/FadL/TodX) [Rosistilla ulvae]|uniref:Outer membrane protein transport protein (OMPP1/FadL/TodX) n=1 Tax=Rosistilla ulvae TaxID=1930277 RepID=A0A517M7Q7_9BACT|nr:outer membrane protein transport protein [Rosistilla ulvae]QDS90895.1 Outer membrane protein transport protein (OMPP1/FadL/TodX) [Rosistilla ulvae]
MKTLIIPQIFATTVAFLVAGSLSAQGIVLPGAGPINRSMGGASTAAPIDAAGALLWNPGSITALGSSQMMFGAEFLYTRTTLDSSLPADAFGPAIPTVPIGGSSDSHSGVPVLPTIALVFTEPDSDFAFGLGVFTIGGFGVNYSASATNPLLTPQPPNGFGIGNAYSRLNLLQIAPTVAVQLIDGLSVGFAPTVTMGDLALAPALFAAPDNADGGLPTYSDAQNGRWRYALGFQVGVYLETMSGWNFGASFKSKQWFEEFEFQSAGETGAPRTLTANPEYPMIISLGTSFTGFEGWVSAVDVRYIDYANASVFGDDAAFQADGSVPGLGWDSTVGVALGLQREFQNGVSLRAGYDFGQSPISNDKTGFNVLSSALWNHAVTTGATLPVNHALSMSLAYVHVFEASSNGAIQTPAGPIPGSSVEITQVSDTLSMGFDVKF